MLRLQKHARPLTAITVATVVALVAFVPSIASADRSTPAASAAAKKKKKKKKKQVIATVNGSFTIRANLPNDNGPDWQQLKVVIKNAKIPFRHNAHSALASANVRFYYLAETHTSLVAGCSGMDRTTSGDWWGWTSVRILPTYWLRTNGKQKQYLGWEVIVSQPDDGIDMETISSYQGWRYDDDGQRSCRTIENKPYSYLDHPNHLQPGGLGKLSSDKRSVRLSTLHTDVNQWGSLSGSIKFNQSVWW